MADKKRNGLELSAKPFGPTQDQLAAVGERVLKSANVRKSIGAGKVRLLYVEALDDDDEDDEAAAAEPLSRHPVRRQNHRAILVDGSFAMSARCRSH